MALTIHWLTPDRFDLKPDKSTWIEMAKVFIDDGHDVTILTSKSKHISQHKQEYDNFTQYLTAIDLPFIFRFSVLFNMFFWLKKNALSNDVIIINQDALILVPFLKLVNIKNIHLDIRTLPVNMHTIKDKLDNLLYWDIPLKLFGQSVHSYSFITERLKQELDKQLNWKVLDYSIWQSGVSTDSFYPKTLNKTKKSPAFRLFYHGTITTNRGIGLVIEALALIEKKIPVEFVIIGNGPGLEELKMLASNLLLDERVIFRGFMPYKEMVNEISQADICICPLTDRLEWNVSSPIKVFEYMACGKPMILTPIPAHKDVVSQSPYVVWTEGFEPINFQKSILEAISRKKELTEEAKSAPALVKANYDWCHQARKLEKSLNIAFRKNTTPK